MSFGEEAADHRFQRVVVEAKNAIAEKREDLFLARRDRFSCRRFLAVGLEVDLDLRTAGQNGQRFVIVCFACQL